MQGSLTVCLNMSLPHLLWLSSGPVSRHICLTWHILTPCDCTVPAQWRSLLSDAIIVLVTYLLTYSLTPWNCRTVCGVVWMFVRCQVQMYQLSRLLHDHHKDLYDHFEMNDVAPTLYAAPWFLTVFASQFPIGFVARVFGKWHTHVFCICLVPGFQLCTFLLYLL